jgi:hypothetical protein
MTEVDPRDKTVKVRLKGDQAEALAQYADSQSLPLSTTLRMLALEALQYRQQKAAVEDEQRKLHNNMLRRQLGGS